MEDFYRRILRGEPRAEALRQAQLEMKKKYPEPFYSRRVHLPGRSGAIANASLKGRRQLSQNRHGINRQQFRPAVAVADDRSGDFDLLIHPFGGLIIGNLLVDTPSLVSP
jgi:hypothetical protein